MTEQLVRYDAMVAAISACHRVDEVKKIRTVAVALAAAARVARNTDAERKAFEIRMRAEAHGGRLLAKLKRGPRGGNGGTIPASVAGMSEYAEALEANELDEREARRWQNLARMPEQEFEAAFSYRLPRKKRAKKVKLERRAPKKQETDDALWFWGRLRDFETMHLLEQDPQILLDEMTDSMRGDVQRLAPRVAAWLDTI
jgi:hypothetical protein